VEFYFTPLPRADFFQRPNDRSPNLGRLLPSSLRLGGHGSKFRFYRLDKLCDRLAFLRRKIVLASFCVNVEQGKCGCSQDDCVNDPSAAALPATRKPDTHLARTTRCRNDRTKLRS